MKRFISTMIRNTVFVNVAIIVIMLSGLITSRLMVREEFPEIAVNSLQVFIAYPGADPAETEEGVSRKIEEAIDGIGGIERYTTVSSEGAATAIIEVVEGFDIDKLYTDVRNAVDSISSFPRDAEKPVISKLLIKNQVIMISLWGAQTERVLKEFAETVKDEVQALASVSQVSVFGTRDYEMAIEVSEERLREYGLSFADVAGAVRRGSLNLGGGQLRTRGEEIRLRTVGRKYSGEDFASIVVLARPNGEIITLDRIASIRDGFMEDSMISTFNGEPSVTIAVFKTTSEDVVAIAKEVRGYVSQKQSELPVGLNAALWSDRSLVIEGRIAMLLRNGFIGLCIVFFSLWLFLDLRLSFWVTMGIPISLSGGLLIMWFLGLTLNELSLFGLLMVLGIVVDDAIIVGESIYVQRKSGEPPLLAATSGVMEVGLPVLAAVSTTIIAFIPLLFIDGIMGRFIKIVPVAVIASLTMSLIESLFLLPAHLNNLPGASAATENRSAPQRARLHISQGLEWFVGHVYVPFMAQALHFRYVTFCASILVFLATLGLVFGGHVKFVLFPQSDGADLVANIEFPRGTPGGVTHAAILDTEDAFKRVIARLPEKNGVSVVRNTQTITGQSGAGDFERTRGNHVGHVRAELVKSGERLVSAQDILIAWEEEMGTIPGALAQSFTTQEMGPPGAPIQVALRSEDLNTLLAASEVVKAKLRTYDGVYQVSDTFRPGKNELQIDVKPEARTLGLTLDDLARQVYAGYFGEEALRIQRGRDDIRVRVRYTEDQRGTLADLEQMRIRTPQGHEVPFFSVADVKFAGGFSSISRVNGIKSISVMAENDPREASADEIISDLSVTTMSGLDREYPDLLWAFEGAQKDSRDAFSGLMISFPFALIGIFVVVATIFRSYIQPMIIMATVPLGIIGAVWGHWAMGIDLAMFSVFGMVALTGVVVNDAIVLIEAVNRNLASGREVFDAIERGGARRFRAILLTTISTVGGLLPLIIETDAGAVRVTPMALSIASGVLFATLLTLIYVPCLLAILNDFRRLAHFGVRNRWPSREEVEPARLRNIDILAEEESAADGTSVGGPIAAK